MWHTRVSLFLKYTGVQLNNMDKTDKLNQPLTREMFDRLDENDDGLFYTAPRKLVHIDDGAIAAAGQ